MSKPRDSSVPSATRLLAKADNTDAEPVVSVTGLAVAIAGEHGLQHVVKDLAITITRGETFALVGESGCGKSMTALAMLRLLPDAARVVGGQVDLGGADLNRLPEHAMRGVRGGRVGIIFQEPATSLNPVMRVGDQIVETLRVHTRLRGRQARERAVQWLHRVGIHEPERRIDDYPFQFSGGQKQRIMIAIALAAEPQLLIADEPTTALDVTVQAQVLDLLADIQRELGMAILLITHDLAVVRNVAHHVALMRHGEIVENASARVFFEAPRHPYARQLFNAIPSFEKRGRRLSGGIPSHAEAGTPLASGLAALTKAAAAFHELDDALFETTTQHGLRQTAGTTTTAAASTSQQGQDAPTARREPGPVLLRVQNLKVHYPVRKGWLRRLAFWVKAVDGVSFDLRAGETLALLGESGCGKTTTGKALLRLIDGAHIDGLAELDGHDLLRAGRSELKALRQHIQIVFQDPYASLDPRMRIGEILQEGVAALRPELSAAQRLERAAELVARVGLPDDTLSRYPHEFSGGQRQRIAIARALAVEPKLLIFDEPTSALDVSVQAQILDLMHDLQQEFDIAYLFITHNFSVVEYLADRIAVMHAGTIVELGQADAVLHAPRHEVTRTLLASVPRLAFGSSHSSN